MLYSRFCIKKMGIPLTLIILQQLDTIFYANKFAIMFLLRYNIKLSSMCFF